MDDDSAFLDLDEHRVNTKIIESARLVVSMTVEGATVKMSGDKRLIGVQIPPESIRDWTPEKLGRILQTATNRIRALADHRASTFCMGAMTARTRELRAEAPPDSQSDVRVMAMAELVAGTREELTERGWGIADLVEHTGLDEQLLDDLLDGFYIPMARVTRGTKGLAAAMDLACPLAEAFGVSPEALWAKGVKRIAELDRLERIRIKRLLRGMTYYKRKRKAVDKSLASLKLGQLKAQGVTHEYDLEVAIAQENTIELMRWGRDWMPRKRKPDYLDNDNWGALLAPSGWTLKKNVTREEFLRLRKLDAKAKDEPESITGDELKWVRELTGLPALEIADGAT